MSAPQYNFEVNAGETLVQVLRYAAMPLVSKPITAITQAAPVQISATGHGLVAGWPAAVVSAGGMTQINAKRYPPLSPDWHQVTVPDPNTVQFNDVNSADFSAYTSGGFLVYPTPAVLTGMTGVFSIFDSFDQSKLLVAYTTAPVLVFSDAAKTITLTLPTAGLTWATGYYELIVTDTSGNPKELVNGVITILP